MWYAVVPNPAHPVIAEQGLALTSGIGLGPAVLLLLDREISYDVDEIILIVKSSEKAQRIIAPIFRRILR
jgi:hypothetical protein